MHLIITLLLIIIIVLLFYIINQYKRFLSYYVRRELRNVIHKEIDKSDLNPEVAEVLHLMKHYPEQWDIDKYHAKHKKGYSIWIANDWNNRKFEGLFSDIEITRLEKKLINAYCISLIKWHQRTFDKLNNSEL